MSDATSTIFLKVDSSQATTSLRELTTSITTFKTALSNLGTLTDGYAKIKQEVQALKTALADYQSGVKSAGETEASTGSKSKAVWESRRISIDGATHSYKQLSKVTREQVDADVAAGEVTKRTAAERKLGLQQATAAQMEAARVAKIASQESAMWAKHEADQLAKTRAERAAGVVQAKAEAENARREALAVAAAKKELLEIERQLEAQRLRTARFNTSSPKAQLNTLNTAASFGAQGGDVAKRFGPDIAALANQAEITKRTLELAAATQRATTSVGGNAAAHAAAQLQLAGHSAAVAHHREQQAMLHSTLRGVAGGMDNLWLTYGRYVGHMIGAYAAVTAARKSMQEGVQFDYQSRFISALGNDRSPDAYKQVQAGLEGVKDAPASVNELAASLRTLQQTGVDSAQGLGLLPTVIAAATLGETTMKTATEDLVGVLEVFNLHSEDPNKLAANFKGAGDVMAYVAQETKANLHDVAASMQGVTGVAQQYGVRMETAAASIATLGKQGIVGSRAGTYTRSMMEALYVPTSAKAEKVTKELDFSMFDKAGNVKDNLKGILELVEKLKEYDPQSQARMIDSLFPAWGAKAFRGIFNDVDAFIDKQKEAGEQAGLLARQQEELSRSTQYQLKQLGADWDNLFTKAGSGNELLAEPIKALRDALKDPNTVESLKAIVTDIVKLGSFAAQNAEYVLGFVKALAALAVGQAAAGTLSMLGTAARAVGPALGAGSLAMQSMTAVAAGTATTLSGRAGLMGALSMLPVLLGGVSIPLVALAGVAAAAGAAFYLFRDRTVEAMNEVAASVSKSAQGAMADLAELEKKIGQQSSTSSLAQLQGAGSKLTGVNSSLSDAKDKLKTDFGLTNEDQIWVSAYSNNVSSSERSAAQAVVKIISERDKLSKQYYQLKETAEDIGANEANAKALAESERKADPKTVKHYDGGSKKDRGAAAAENDLSRAAVKRMESALKVAKKEYETIAAQIDTDVENFVSSKSEGIAKKHEAEIQMLLNQSETLKGQINLAHRRGKKADEEAARGKLAEVQEATATAQADVTLALTKNQQALNKDTAEYIIAKQEENDELAFQITLIGRTELEVQKLIAARKDELEFQKRANTATVEDGQVVLKPKENHAELSVAHAKAKKEKDRMATEEYKAQRSFSAGWSKAYQSYVDDTSNAATMAADAFKLGTSSMEDAIYNLMTNTKTSYKDMVKTALQELARLAAKQAAMGLVKLGVSLASSYFGSSSGTTATTAPNNSAGTGLGSGSYSDTQLSAHGNVYNSASLSSYSNSVYSSPRAFAFAKGAGIFAEAGPEAIMPLTRTATGDLGVRAIGGGGGAGAIEIKVTVQVASDGSSNTSATASDKSMNSKALGEMIGQKVKQVIVEEMRSGGMLQKARG